MIDQNIIIYPTHHINLPEALNVSSIFKTKSGYGIPKRILFPNVTVGLHAKRKDIANTIAKLTEKEFFLQKSTYSLL